MTNEEILEEIMYAAHKHGIAEKVLDEVRNMKNEGLTLSRNEMYIKAYYKYKPKS